MQEICSSITWSTLFKLTVLPLCSQCALHSLVCLWNDKSLAAALLSCTCAPIYRFDKHIDKGASHGVASWASWDITCLPYSYKEVYPCFLLPLTIHSIAEASKKVGCYVCVLCMNCSGFVAVALLSLFSLRVIEPCQLWMLWRVSVFYVMLSSEQNWDVCVCVGGAVFVLQELDRMHLSGLVSCVTLKMLWLHFCVLCFLNAL